MGRHTGSKNSSLIFWNLRELEKKMAGYKGLI
jgi:hypothetical protein